MKIVILILGTFIIIGLLALSPLYAYHTDKEITCTIASKERIVKSNSSKYLIFCEDEVLQNTDSLWYWKWNSSDFYRELKEGEEYNLRVYGWRIPFLSMYSNIIEIN